MMAWMAYAALIGGLVAGGALALERLAVSTGRPRRFVWLAALALAVVIPLVGTVLAPRVQPAVESESAAAVKDGGAVAETRWSIIPPLPLPADGISARAATIVWGAASLAALVVLFGVLVFVARARRRWERKWIHGADVYVSRRFGPALVGVAKPEVVVPSWVLRLEPSARAAIVRHEVEHARARDHLALLYAGLVAAAFPWSPAIWWMCRRLRAAVELDCDQRVIASGIGVTEYGDVLLDAGSRSWSRWGFAPAMSQPKSLLERRLKVMSEKRKKLSVMHGALLAGAAMVALAVACDTPVPTEILEAIDEVVAEERDTEGADGVFGLVSPPLVYIDGIRVDIAGEWSGLLETLVPDLIDRIEIIKGPAAAQLYGEEAANGVIQVFTKESFPNLLLKDQRRSEAINRAERLIVTRIPITMSSRSSITIRGNAKVLPPPKPQP